VRPSAIAANEREAQRGLSIDLPACRQRPDTRDTRYICIFFFHINPREGIRSALDSRAFLHHSAERVSLLATENTSRLSRSRASSSSAGGKRNYASDKRRTSLARRISGRAVCAAISRELDPYRGYQLRFRRSAIIRLCDRETIAANCRNVRTTGSVNWSSVLDRLSGWNSARNSDGSAIREQRLSLRNLDHGSPHRGGLTLLNVLLG
jgi:hypothetical protein